MLSGKTIGSHAMLQSPSGHDMVTKNSNRAADGL